MADKFGSSAPCAASLRIFQALEHRDVKETIKLIEGAPEAVKERDAYGRLPIHVAIETQAPVEKMRHLAAELHAARRTARRCGSCLLSVESTSTWLTSQAQARRSGACTGLRLLVTQR